MCCMANVDSAARRRALVFCVFWVPMAWVVALPPAGIWPVGLIAYVPLLWVCSERRYMLPQWLSAGAVSGLVLGLTVFWSLIVNPFESFLGKAVLLAFFALFVSVHYLFVFVAARAQGRLRRLAAFPVGIIGVEYALSESGFGLPLFSGLMAIDAPFAALAVRGLGHLAPSVVVVVVNVCVWRMLCVRAKTAGLLALGVAGMLSLSPLYPVRPYEERGVRVGYVQQAVPQSAIHAAERFSPLYWDIAEAYIRELQLFDPAPDIAVIPENAFLLHYPEHEDVFSRIMEIAEREGMELIVPALLSGEEGEGAYNSVLHVGKEGTVRDSYRKTSLVPGHESDAFAAGTEYSVFSTALRIGPMICYDSVFPSQYAWYRDAEAELIVVAAEAGFVRGSNVPWMHLAFARLYSMAYEIPVLHVSQSGPSALYTPDGRRKGYTGKGQQAAVVVEL